MHSLLTKIRLKWFITTRTLDYTQSYLERIYKIYLNHNKIIHFRDGYPVYSLSTPALYSRPAANFFARSLFRTIQNKNLPNMMSFAINDVCDANCEYCSFFEGVADESRKVMNLKQKQQLLHEAQELGVSVINFVGGEPLLLPDLPKVIKSVDKDLSTTVLFTNGSLLGDRAKELKEAGLDSIYVNLNSADPKIHDRRSKKEGLFEQAMKGIQKAKLLGFSLGISSCMTPGSFKNGELESIIELGKKIGIHEVLIFDAMPTGRYRFRKDLMNTNEWTEKMIEKSKKYNQDPSYPGVLVWAYATSHRSVGCSCGTSYFYVSPYGDVMSCDFNHVKFGNVLETPLYKIWDNLSSSPDFKQAKWGGCKIKDPNYRSRKIVLGGGS